MSTPFTSPYSEAGLQDLLDEIVLAYSERRQAIGQTAYTPEDDRDIQDKDYWRGLQNWIEGNCPNFVNHVNGPLDAVSGMPLFFTLQTFRAASGLHADGFRRATAWDGVDDPIWAYGQMQAGDIIGPWIIEDLQKAFSVMSAVQWGAYRVDKDTRRAGLLWYNTRAAADAAYDSLSWELVLGQPPYVRTYSTDEVHNYSGRHNLTRSMCATRGAINPVPSSGRVDVYYQGFGYAYDIYSDHSDGVIESLDAWDGSFDPLTPYNFMPHMTQRYPDDYVTVNKSYPDYPMEPTNFLILGIGPVERPAWPPYPEEDGRHMGYRLGDFGCVFPLAWPDFTNSGTEV